MQWIAAAVAGVVIYNAKLNTKPRALGRIPEAEKQREEMFDEGMPVRHGGSVSRYLR